jgi:hypothetical protein
MDKDRPVSISKSIAQSINNCAANIRKKRAGLPLVNRRLQCSVIFFTN